MIKLPEGWSKTSIGQVCRLVNGRAFKPSDWTQYGLPIVRIQNLNRREAKFNYFAGAVDERFLIEDGDLLFAWSGTPGTSFGAHVWAGGQAILNQHIFNVRFDRSSIDRDFLKHAINQTLEEQIAKAHGGVGLAHVTKGNFEATQIALPPLPEQRRIVAKIDSLSSNSKRAREQLNHIPRLVEKYKHTVLTAAFRGDLTQGWRKAHKVHRPWGETTVGTLLTDIVAGKNLRCEERPPKHDERGTLKVSAVTWGVFDPSQTKTLPKDFVPTARTRVQVADLLISRANTLELVGAVVIVHETPSNLFLSDKVLRLELVDADKPWLLWYLRSPLGRRQIEEGSSGNQLSMRNLSQNNLRAISLPWPDPLEREEIVRRIQHAFTWIDRLAAEAGSARKLVDHLDEAILAKAFRGELVPQDPNDEPANLLLERLETERTTAVEKAKRKKRRAAASS